MVRTVVDVGRLAGDLVVTRRSNLEDHERNLDTRTGDGNRTGNVGRLYERFAHTNHLTERN